MSFYRSAFCALVILLLSAAPALAQEAPTLAAAAGYKKMVNELVRTYSAQTGNTLNLIYGNMAKVAAQTKLSGKVDAILGDGWFFRTYDFDFQRVETLGTGKLTLVCSRQYADRCDDLSKQVPERLAIGDAKRSIYGRAAIQYLERAKLMKKLEPHLVRVSTVPQVGSYVMAGEVDMGFVNLTHALNIADELGGYIIIDQKLYDPIRIQVGVFGDTSESKVLEPFLSWLETDEAKRVISKHGL